MQQLKEKEREGAQNILFKDRFCFYMYWKYEK